MLVTSRESLRITAEREYALRPLPQSPAVELFRQRAAAVEPDLEIEERTASAICTKLDRLPLAIELAAARVKVLTPEALLERLDQRLPLLVSRARDVPERQRTLHSTIAWSYELLSGEEQQLFRRFAVFAGGATLESLADIAEADSELVESIVDKSLLRRRGARFVMLETIREFALELFEASDDAEAIRRRHARFFLATAENTNLNAAKLDVRKEMRHDIALAEQDNIRAALEWSLASGAVALGLELAAWIEWFWIMHDAREGMRWFEALFEHPEADTVPPRVRADALRAYGSSTDIAGQDQVAERLYRESLGLFEQLGDEHGRAVLLHRLGIQAMRRGELQRARELVEASHEIHERREDRWGQCQTVGTLGAIARDAADDATASALIGQSREIAREVGVPWWESGMLAELACLSLYGGRFEDAEVQARESLALAEQLHDRPGRVFGVGLLAGVAAERGDLQRAGRLWGAIEEEDAVAPLGGWRRHRASIEARLRAPADDRFERARDAGRDLSLDEAVEYALAES